MNDELPEGEKPPARRATDPVGESGIQLIEEIKRSLRRLSVATIVLFVVILTAVGLGYRQSNAVNDSLCTLRGDLEARIVQTTEFIKHPDKFPQFSDPNLVALVKTQLEGQQRTVDSLSNLSC